MSRLKITSHFTKMPMDLLVRFAVCPMHRVGRRASRGRRKRKEEARGEEDERGYFRCVVNDSVGPCVDVGGASCSAFNIWVGSPRRGRIWPGSVLGKGAVMSR